MEKSQRVCVKNYQEQLTTLTQSQNTTMTVNAIGLESELSTCPLVEPKSVSLSTSRPEKTDLALGSKHGLNTIERVKLSLFQQRKRQASRSIDLTFYLFVTSGVITVFGIALLFFGKVQEGTVTTAGGLASNLVSERCLRFTKYLNDELDKTVKDLEDEN